MDRVAVRGLLVAVREGRTPIEEALEDLAVAPTEDLAFATVDLQRAVRTGVPEVVYGSGKTGEQIAAILGALLASGQAGLATRVEAAKADVIRARLGDARVAWHPDAEVIVAREGAEPDRVGLIGVIDAGTSDRRVSEEAAVVAAALGNEVLRIHDVGVAGLHRILSRLHDLRRCRVIVVAAGLDGALPGVVAGLVSVPVIAVPTSVGYGASFGGLAALLTMLNACAPGVSVVNIDNGFGAAYQASLINRLGLTQ